MHSFSSLSLGNPLFTSLCIYSRHVPFFLDRIYRRLFYSSARTVSQSILSRSNHLQRNTPVVPFTFRFITPLVLRFDTFWSTVPDDILTHTAGSWISALYYITTITPVDTTRNVFRKFRLNKKKCGRIFKRRLSVNPTKVQ